MSFIPHRDSDVRRLSAHAAICAILPLDLYPAHKDELLSVCLWKITERDGKLNVRYATPAALNELKVGDKSGLRHEHVFERAKLIDALIESPERQDDILKNAIACIVTKIEHDGALAHVSETLHGWARYKAAKLTVIDRVTGQPVDLSSV